MANDSIPLHGGQLREIAERFHLAEGSLLDFSANISPIPLGEAVIEALCESLRSRKALSQYPDSEYRDLKNAISTYARIDRGSVCIANGVMPLLDAAVRALGLRRCLILAPAFGEYRRLLKALNIESLTLLLSEVSNFLLDPDIVLRTAMSSRVDAVLLANPHSPSGCLTQAPVLRELQRTLSRCGIATILDEAFIDFCPKASISKCATRVTDLVVLRSLTKFFAIPGMRVAYAVVHPEVRERMESMLPLWPVDSLAAEAARLVLLDKTGVRERQEVNARERQWLSEELASLGWRVSPSSANFLLVRAPGEVDGLDIWLRLILEHRIVLRNCSTFEGLTDTYFRISVKNHAENVALASSLARLF